MEIYEKLVRVRDMVSLDTDPDAWVKRAEVLSQVAAQCFVNEDKRDDIPKGFYISNCELSLEELKDLLQLLDLPVDSMKMEVTSIDPVDGQIFVEIFMN